MSELVKYAKSELRGAGMFDPDADYDGDVAPAVVSLMETFSVYGDSGGKAAMILTVFDRLAQGKPLAPLTGDDSEWEETQEPGLFQNLRCSKVFKRIGTDACTWCVLDPSTHPEAHTGDGKIETISRFPYTVK